MNNNKGFTLVELIAAIVLLSLVVGITSYSIIGIINRNKEENYNLLIKNINSAAETYYQECRYSNNDMINCNKIENDEYMVSLGDLVNYGTTEMIGIKSVNIEYAKSCVPIITVQFTDVRGLSLFQPTELSRDNTYNGIKGLNKDNVAQSFFQCF